jgi:hypothetical protein
MQHNVMVSFTLLVQGDLVCGPLMLLVFRLVSAVTDQAEDGQETSETSADFRLSW